MKNIFLYLSIVTLSLSCFSCDDDEELEVVTIGDASNIYISSEAGRREVPLTATCAWTVERDSLTRQWVNIERKSGEGDGSFNLVWRANEKFPRKGKVIVKLANKVKADTIYIYQYGVSPSIAFPDKEARVSAVGKELEVNLNTNIPASDSTRIAMTVDYDKGEEWVSQLLFNKEMNKMQVKVAANEPEVGERNATLHITYVDDWGKAHTTDFNIGQKYTSILNAYKNIDQKIANITSKLSSNPTEIGYETLLPSLSLLKNNIYSKFVEIEQRVNPTITISILESVVLEDSQSSELKVEIRNSSDSARDVHINRLKAFGGDLTEANTVNIDVRLSADEEKTISIELHMCDRVFNENAAEVEFEIDYDDIFIATDQRVHETKIEGRTIRFNKETFTEIDNKFRHASGGEELEAGDSMFYGRESLIVNIQNAILNGSKNQIAIYGQKRSGKSSLLNQIIGRLESTENGSVICGKFSLQGLPDEESNPVNWILRNIAYSLLRGIRKSRIKNIDKSILELFKTESDAFTALREFIEYINTIVELQNSHFVILIDEFTYLYQLIKDGKVSEDFMRRWIALIETPDINLQTIVAAQDTLPHFMNESYASNYFNKFSKEPLSYLSREEAIQLIKDPIKNVVFLNHCLLYTSPIPRDRG